MNIIKKLAIVGIVLCCVGSMMLGIGVVQGGGISHLYIQKANNGWWPFINMQTYSDDKTKVVYEESFYPQQQLYVSVEKASLEIKKGNTNKILLQNIEKNNVQINTNKNKVTVKVKGTIKSNQHVVMEVKDIDVIETLSVDSSMGKSNISDMKLKSLDITSNMGNVTVSNMISQTTNIHNETGEIIVENGMFYHTKLTNNMGNISFNGDMYGNNEISCNMGNITLDLKRKEEAYTYDVNVDMGRVNIDGNDKRKTSIHKDNGAKNDYLNIDCDMGNVDVIFAS